MNINTTILSFVLVICYAVVAVVLAKLFNTSVGDIAAWMALGFIASKQAEDLMA